MISRLVALTFFFMHHVFLSNLIIFFQVLLLSHPKKDIRDTSEYEVFRRLDGLGICCDMIILVIAQTVLTCEFQFTRERKRRSLKDLAAEVLGAKIQQNEHCPVCVILYAWI